MSSYSSSSSPPGWTGGSRWSFDLLDPLWYVAQKIATIQRRFDRRVRERWQARDAGLQEGVAGAAVIQTYGRRRHEVKRYVNLTIEGYRAAMRLFYMRVIEGETRTQ